MTYFELIALIFNEHKRCTLGSIFERATRSSPTTLFKHGSFIICDQYQRWETLFTQVFSAKRKTNSIATFAIRLYTFSIPIKK